MTINKNKLNYLRGFFIYTKTNGNAHSHFFCFPFY